jgi:hypothetical protein
MAPSTQEKERLTARFSEFQSLDAAQGSKLRKDIVHVLESEVKTGRISLTQDDVHGYQYSDFELARILVYVLVESGKVNSDALGRRNHVLAEWERLRRANLVHDLSRMPLYYAIRAYLTLLRSSAAARENARGDCTLIRQIDSQLEDSEIDRKSQLRDRTAEFLFLICRDKATENPTIIAALIQRRGALIGSLVAAAALIAGTLIANWDKIRGSQASQSSPISQPKP